jgi:hypothetical protein
MEFKGNVVTLTEAELTDVLSRKADMNNGYELGRKVAEIAANNDITLPRNLFYKFPQLEEQGWNSGMFENVFGIGLETPPDEKQDGPIVESLTVIHEEGDKNE